MVKASKVNLQVLRVHLKDAGYGLADISKIFDMSITNISRKFNDKAPFSLDEIITLFCLLRKEGIIVKFEEIFKID